MASGMDFSRRCRMSCVHRAHFLNCDIACGCWTVTDGPGTRTKGLLLTKTRIQPTSPSSRLARTWAYRLSYVQNGVYRGECQRLSLPVISRCGELASSGSTITPSGGAATLWDAVRAGRLPSARNAAGSNHTTAMSSMSRGTPSHALSPLAQSTRLIYARLSYAWLIYAWLIYARACRLCPEPLGAACARRSARSAPAAAP